METGACLVKESERKLTSKAARQKWSRGWDGQNAGRICLSISISMGKNDDGKEFPP